MASLHRKGADKKDLGRYVSQVMKAKGLSARDVADRSGNKITPAYVMAIGKGTAANPSVDKVKALATGLGIDRHELFSIACGPEEGVAHKPQANERLQALELLDLMKRVVVGPWLMKILEQAAYLEPKELEALLSSVYRLREARPKAGGKKKRR